MQPLKWDTPRTAADAMNLYVAPEPVRLPVPESFGLHLRAYPPTPQTPPHQPEPPRRNDVGTNQYSTTTSAPPRDDRSQLADEQPSQRKDSESSAVASDTPTAPDGQIETEAASSSSQNEQASSTRRSDRAKPDAKGTAEKLADEPSAGTRQANGATGRTKSAKSVSAKDAQAETNDAQSAANATAPAQPTLPIEVECQCESCERNQDPAANELPNTSEDSKAGTTVAAVPIATPLESLTTATAPSNAAGGKRPKHSGRVENLGSELSASNSIAPSKSDLDPAAMPETTSNTELLDTAVGLAANAISSGSSTAREAGSGGTAPQPLRFAQHLAAKPGERPAKSSPLTEVEQARLVDRVRAFRTAEGRGGLVTLRLHPPELGVLRVELRIQEGTLSARMEAETPAARSLLLENVHILRDRLAEQGVRIERFDVDLLDRRPPGDAQTFQQHAPQDHSDRRTIAPTRVTVESAETDPTRPGPRMNSTGQLNVIV